MNGPSYFLGIITGVVAMAAMLTVGLWLGWYA